MSPETPSNSNSKNGSTEISGIPTRPLLIWSLKKDLICFTMVLSSRLVEQSPLDLSIMIMDIPLVKELRLTSGILKPLARISQLSSLRSLVNSRRISTTQELVQLLTLASKSSCKRKNFREIDKVHSTLMKIHLKPNLLIGLPGPYPPPLTMSCGTPKRPVSKTGPTLLDTESISKTVIRPLHQSSSPICKLLMDLTLPL
jgi:hypothetical protein